MRTQIAMLEDYRNCDVGPETALWNVRPYGREVIWKEDGRATIWHTFILEENYNPDTFDLEKLEGERIPEEYYRLPYDPAWTEVKGPLQHDQFLKVVEPTGYSAAETERTWPASELREEIVIHEQLKLHPHPNVVRYHGVQVEDGYVVGLVLDKLDVNVIEALEYPIKKSRLWTVEEVVKDIKQGLDHLHALGIMHGDVSLSNIMLDTSGRAVLIDFDSAFRIGELRYGKMSNGHYSHVETKYCRATVTGEIEPYACAEVDLDCLALVHRELIELDKRRAAQLH